MIKITLEKKHENNLNTFLIEGLVPAIYIKDFYDLVSKGREYTISRLKGQDLFEVKATRDWYLTLEEAATLIRRTVERTTVKTYDLVKYRQDMEAYSNQLKCTGCGASSKGVFRKIDIKPESEVWLCQLCQTPITVSTSPEIDYYTESFSLNGMEGVSPISMMRSSIQVKTPDALSEEAYKRIKESFTTTYTGPLPNPEIEAVIPQSASLTSVQVADIVLVEGRYSGYVEGIHDNGFLQVYVFSKGYSSNYNSIDIKPHDSIVRLKALTRDLHLKNVEEREENHTREKLTSRCHLAATIIILIATHVYYLWIR